MTDKMYQNIILELTDGRFVCCTVPAFCQKGEHISAKAIQITESAELSEGCAFEIIKDRDD